VTESELTCERSDPGVTHAIRAGCLALGGVMLFLLIMSALETAVLRKTLDLELTWTGSHAGSPNFRLAVPGEYVFALSVPDSSVPTGDQHITSVGRQWTQRCGQPFPAGLTWSLYRYERVIDSRTVQTSLWCEDPAQGHELRQAIGSFRVHWGTGYSIRIEPADWADLRHSSFPPLHLHVWLTSRWYDGTPILLICDTVFLFGLISLALGFVRWADQ
jgi:hypothetical protein